MKELAKTALPILFFLPLAGNVSIAGDRAADRTAGSSQKEIRVSLFGQPCALAGPLPETTLNAIHSISPERIPPAMDANSTHEALEKVKKATDLPAALDSYREKLTHRLEAQVAFYTELATAARTGKTKGLDGVAKKNVQSKQLKSFQAQLKKLATPANLKEKKSAAIDQLIEAYNDAIEPHPEEDFHRAIGRIGVNYNCSFEESDADNVDSSSN